MYLMGFTEKFRKILKNKMVRFVIRFLVHLISMLTMSVLVTKLYFGGTSLNDLLLIQREFIWLPVLAALVTSIIGDKFNDR